MKNKTLLKCTELENDIFLKRAKLKNDIFPTFKELENGTFPECKELKNDEPKNDPFRECEELENDELDDGTFPMYTELKNDVRDREKNNLCFDRNIVYIKLKKPLSKEHSIFVMGIILRYIQLNEPERFEKLLVVHAKSIKGKGKEKSCSTIYKSLIYGNKRNTQGKSRGETHNFSEFPDNLLKLLESYIDYSRAIDKDLRSEALKSDKESVPDDDKSVVSSQ